MTKSDIQTLISTQIKGQGDQIDISGKLPGILESLAERMSDAATVTVKIYPYKLNDDEDAFEADTTGVEGTLYVKGFDAFGNPIAEQAIPFVGEEGAETIDIEVPAHTGDTIGVTAKIPGKGASCQLVTKVVKDCTLKPEVYPAGIYEFGDGSVNVTPGDDMYNGAVIVTEDFAILWPKYQRANFDSETKPWGPLCQIIPSVLVTDKYTEAVKDFDGALNTAAILSVIGGGSAAQIASEPTPEAQYNATGFFLPSLGILKYLYDHRTEINAFIAAETTAYEPDEDYQTVPTANWFWSSTLYNEAVDAWGFYFDYGGVDCYDRGYDNYVLAISAFQTSY